MDGGTGRKITKEAYPYLENLPESRQIFALIMMEEEVSCDQLMTVCFPPPLVNHAI